MRCMGYCKKKAVEAGHSWAFLQYFIVTIPVIKMITSWLMENTGFTFEIQNYWVAILFETIYFLPATATYTLRIKASPDCRIQVADSFA